MNIERISFKTVNPSRVSERRSGGSAVLYPEMGEADYDQRISLRAGELLITTALADEQIRLRLKATGRPIGEVFEENDPIKLSASAVCEVVKEVAGNEGVLRVIGKTQKRLDNFGLNGDREAVEDEFNFLYSKHRRELKPPVNKKTVYREIVELLV